MREAVDLQALKSRVPLSEVVGRAVRLKRAGRELKGRCPFHDDRSPSFYVDDGKGVFLCFGCGAKGDVLDFVMLSERVALPEAARLLGEDEWTARPAKAAKADDLATKIENGRRVWRQARPIAGTLAETYLRHRSITAALPGNLRFAFLPYPEHHGLFPALVAAVQDVHGKVCGVQRIYLAADGNGKAGLIPPGDKKPKDKLSLGMVKGGAIRLGPVASEVVLTEGLEDGLTLAQSLPGKSVWVVCGTEMLPGVEMPDGVRAVTIGRDNDAAGDIATAKAAEAYSEQGRTVRVMRPSPAFKDFNDELRGIAR